MSEEEGTIRDSKLTPRFDWNSRDGVTFDASDTATLVERVREARTKIVNALNLSPLVPPQADTETLNVVDEAWAALSDLTAALEREKVEVIEWKLAKADSDRELERAEREAGTWKASREIWAEEAATAVARAQEAEVRFEKFVKDMADEIAKRQAVVEAARRYLHNVGHHTQGWMVDDDLRRALAALDEQEQA